MDWGLYKDSLIVTFSGLLLVIGAYSAAQSNLRRHPRFENIVAGAIGLVLAYLGAFGPYLVVAVILWLVRVL